MCNRLLRSFAIKWSQWRTHLTAKTSGTTFFQLWNKAAKSANQIKGPHRWHTQWYCTLEFPSLGRIYRILWKWISKYSPFVSVINGLAYSFFNNIISFNKADICYEQWAVPRYLAWSIHRFEVTISLFWERCNFFDITSHHVYLPMP